MFSGTYVRLYNVVTTNKFTKPCDARAELWFCLLNLYQENMRMRPCLYRQKFSRGHPPSPSQLKEVFVYEKRLSPLRKPRGENSARAWSDSLALTEVTRLNLKGDLTIEKAL